MRPILDMDSVAVLLTNACIHSCSNCTQLCGHHSKPNYMSFEDFKSVVDSMAGFPKMFGFHGGEPLLHPDFEKFCEYAASKIPKDHLGLWTCLPKGKEHYREIICKTFGNIFLNDHSRDDVLHCQVLAASEENEHYSPEQKDYFIDHCWVQNFWSASVNSNGAFFCEVAAALSLLIDKPEENLGWDVKKNPDWWMKVTKDYTAQLNRYCKMCGCAMPLKKRFSVEGVDDISPKMFERLKELSPKLKLKKYVISNSEPCVDNRQAATYKDQEYREKIAERYGMFITINEKGFNSPHLRKGWVK